MNFLGHVHVALAGGRDDPDYLLGAVLPDLAPMAGIRLRRGDLDGALGDGVACHLRADEVFHADADFRAGSAAIRRTLAGRGLGNGPARAVGHAGWELLLDGTLLGTNAEEGFHRALAHGARATPRLPPGDRPAWTAFLARITGAGRLRYDEPDWVAERLHAMLARRPLLAVPDDRVGTVAEVLAVHVDDVRTVGPAVLAATGRGTAGP